MGLDRALIEFQTVYISHVLVVPPTIHPDHLSGTPICNKLMRKTFTTVTKILSVAFNVP